MTNSTRAQLRPARLATALAVAVVLTAPAGLHSAADARPRPKCNGVAATIVGTDRAETIRGTGGNDVIAARGGQDKVYGGGGDDIVCGGAGDDRIVSGTDDGGRFSGEGGSDTLVARGDHSVLEGGPGADILTTTKRGTLLLGDGGNDSIFGGVHADTVEGGPGNDEIDLAGGDDVGVSGGSGADVIDGGPGAEDVHGGSGDDTIRPGTGVGGYYYGDDGDDTIATGDGAQALLGGPGDDLLSAHHRGALMHGDAGNDWITGSEFPDTIDAGEGDDNVFGEGGDDLDLNAGAGTDGCVGGGGRDRCDGGSPGTKANTPDDPDVCEAEVKVSCKDDVLPQRWELRLDGDVTRTGGQSGEHAHWELTMILVRRGDPATSALWQYESAHGSFAVTGHYGSCSYTHNGTLDRTFSADLGMVMPERKQYWLDVVAGGEGTRAVTCAGGDGWSETQAFEAWAATEGGPDPIPLDPGASTIMGTWEVDGPNEDIDVDWVITPLGDDPQ